jgi:hypothetical protein
MYKKYVFLEKETNKVLMHFKFLLEYEDGSIDERSIALSSAFESNPTFVEVELDNAATLGWYLENGEYIQYD